MNSFDEKSLKFSTSWASESCAVKRCGVLGTQKRTLHKNVYCVSCTSQRKMNIPFHCLLMLRFCLWTFYTITLLSEIMHHVSSILPQLTYVISFQKRPVTSSSTSENFYIKASRLEYKKSFFMNWC